MHQTLDIVIGTIGTIISLGLVGWGVYYMLKKSHDPAKIVFKLLFTVPIFIACIWCGRSLGIFGPFLIVAMAVVFTLMWTPHLAEWLFSPLTSLFDGGNQAPERKPMYSIAMARRNRGKYHEAVAEVRRQLDQFPNDFEGIMLLSRIQAEDLNDLPGAENTLHHFCDWRGAPLQQVAAAHTCLADWHMKVADIDSARAALQKIITRFPDTEAAMHAEQRIAHLSEAEKMVLARHDHSEVAVPEGVNNVGLLDSTEFLKPREEEPGQQAAAHVKHLEEHPNDTDVRERLALIYARDFKRLDLATMELAQMINEPMHKPKQIAHWLNLLANFQLELGADIATVRSTLEKIVERFPTLPIAELAQRRLARLEGEFKGLRQSPGVKMGAYEQNIGLKYGAPRRQ